MAAAIAALPLPGKTFFNRMSKLPRAARTLIDNGIDLAIAVIQFISTIAREFGNKTSQVADLTKGKFNQIKRDIEIQRLEAESMKFKEQSQDTQKEAKI